MGEVFHENPRPVGRQTGALLAQRDPGAPASGGGSARRPNAKNVPIRPGGRASLIERDNPAECLVFHWDPTSYKISKTANWSEDAVEGGSPLQNYKGCGLTHITCRLLFNDIARPHVTQRTTEDSVEWLMSRLRPRTDKEAGRRGLDPKRGRKWLSIRDKDANRPPPVMVLFGLRDGFECTLRGVDLDTGLQLAPGLSRVGAGDERWTGGDILRTFLDITLVEYVNAPE